MAFNSIPTSLAEMRKVAGSSIDKKYVRGIISFYRKIRETHGVDNPLAFNPTTTSGKSAKLMRALNGDVDIAKLKRECKLDSNFKITWGDGSRGNRGTGNTGNLFEAQLEKGLNDWIEGEEYTSNPYKDFIGDLIKFYNLEDCQVVRVTAEGTQNKKRPIQFIGGNWKIGDADANNYDIGPTVTDLTLETKCKNDRKKLIYLSLKKGGTTTMSNLGVKKIFTQTDIENGKITGTVGEKVLETFGIENTRFCKIFNEAKAGSVSSGGDVANPKYNRRLLESMIRGSIGYGYHYAHKESGSKIKNFPMKKDTCDKATKVSSVTVHYGGRTGTGQRVDITVQTPVMELKFNIRDTSGSPNPWPDKLQSGYKFKDEKVYSISEDGYED